MSIITAVSPSRARATGTLITITVDNSSGVTGAAINSIPLTGFTVVDSTTIRGFTNGATTGVVSITEGSGGSTGSVVTIVPVADTVRLIGTVPWSPAVGPTTGLLYTLSFEAWNSGSAVRDVLNTGSLVLTPEAVGMIGTEILGDINQPFIEGVATFTDIQFEDGIAPASGSIPPTGSIPIITNVSPTSARASGTLLTITVNNSSGTFAATVGGTLLSSFSIVNTTTVQGITSGALSGVVGVTNATGTGTGSNVTIVPVANQIRYVSGSNPPWHPAAGPIINTPYSFTLEAWNSGSSTRDTLITGSVTLGVDFVSGSNVVVTSGSVSASWSNGLANFSNIVFGTASVAPSTFDLRITGTGINRVLGRFTRQAVVPAPTISNITPSSGASGDVFTITGTNLSNATVTFTLGAVALLVTNTETTIVGNVPVGATSGTVTVTTAGGTATTTFTVTGVGAFDGPAELPRVTPLSNLADGTNLRTFLGADVAPVNRQFVVVGNGMTSDFQAKLTAARQATGGPRFVILPNGIDIQGAVNSPFFSGVNADPAHPVVICSEEWFNGTHVTLRGVRNPTAIRPNAPTIRSTAYGVSGTRGFIFPNNAGVENFWIIGLNIRNHQDRYTHGLIVTGYDDVTGGPEYPATPADTPNKVYISHCWTGGTDFDSGGLWHAGVGAVFIWQGREAAFMDSYNSAHGAVANLGSDRGLVWGHFAQGPLLIDNNGSDSFGGMGFLHGGAGQPTANWPICSDVTIKRNTFILADKYNPNSSTALRDVANLTCPYSRKAVIEPKAVVRLLCEYNWIEGWRGPSVNFGHAFTLKGVIQDSGEGFSAGSNHHTVRYNIVFKSRGLVGISASEMGRGPTDTTTRVLPLRYVSVHDNSCIQSQIGDPAPESGARGDAIALGRYNFYGSPYSPTYELGGAGDFSIRNNFIYGGLIAGREFRSGLLSSRNIETNPPFTWEGGCVFENNVQAVGLDFTMIFVENLTNTADSFISLWGGGATYTRNAHFSPSGTPSGITNAPNNLWLTTVAALGITLDNSGLASYNVGSPLLTAGAGGTPIGPDWNVLSVVRTKALSGDWR